MNWLPLLVGLFLTLGVVEGRMMEYSFEEYNALLDYRVARAYAFDYAAIDSLGRVFLDHGVNNTFGLCLLHNHFHVKAGEAMVEIVQNDFSTTHPRSVAPPATWHFPSVVGDEDAFIQMVQPSMMGLTLDGNLRPFEFVDFPASDFASYSGAILSKNLQTFYSRPEYYDAFFRDLAGKLTELNLGRSDPIVVGDQSPSREVVAVGSHDTLRQQDGHHTGQVEEQGGLPNLLVLPPPMRAMRWREWHLR